MALQSKTIDINGQPVAYWENGHPQADPILLLHGSMGDAAFHWQALMRELAMTHRVIAPDLPAFGNTPALPELTYDALLTWLGAFIHTLSLSPVTLAGTSFGGLIARLYAAAYPDEMEALVLINGGVLPSKPTPAAKFLAGVPLVNRAIFRNFATQGIGSREKLAWVVNDPADTEILTDEMVQSAADSVPALAEIMRAQVLQPVPPARIPSAPTLLLWGANDDFSPVKAARRVQNAIPDAKLVEIDECKHAPHLQSPDVVAYQIQHFLEHLNAPSSPNLPGAGLLG